MEVETCIQANTQHGEVGLGTRSALSLRRSCARNCAEQTGKLRGMRAGNMDRVLVVEDDPGVQRALKRLFEPEGFTVELASDGRSGVAALHANATAAVILHLRLPDMCGRDVCREIKQHFPLIPVMILSAAADVMDKVLLLELGADDYVTKPFSPRELRGSIPSEVFQFSGVSVDFSRMQVTRGGAVDPADQPGIQDVEVHGAEPGTRDLARRVAQ